MLTSTRFKWIFSSTISRNGLGHSQKSFEHLIRLFPMPQKCVKHFCSFFFLFNREMLFIKLNAWNLRHPIQGLLPNHFQCQVVERRQLGAVTLLFDQEQTRPNLRFHLRHMQAHANLALFEIIPSCENEKRKMRFNVDTFESKQQRWHDE